MGCDMAGGRFGREGSYQSSVFPAGTARSAEWALAIAAVVGTAWFMSGKTTSAAELCRQRELRIGYHAQSIDWQMPSAEREYREVQNYHARKAHQERLAKCAYARGEPLVTCGPLKCGGLFSFASESSAERQKREQNARMAAEWAKQEPARRAERLRIEQERERRQEAERERVERALQLDREGRFYSLQSNKFQQ